MSNETPTRAQIVGAIGSLRGAWAADDVESLFAPYMAELQELRQRVSNQRLAAQSLLKELDEQKSEAMQEGMVNDWSFIVSETNGVKKLMRDLGLEDGNV